MGKLYPPPLNFLQKICNRKKFGDPSGTTGTNQQLLGTHDGHRTLHRTRVWNVTGSCANPYTNESSEVSPKAHRLFKIINHGNLYYQNMCARIVTSHESHLRNHAVELVKSKPNHLSIAKFATRCSQRCCAEVTNCWECTHQCGAPTTNITTKNPIHKHAPAALALISAHGTSAVA